MTQIKHNLFEDSFRAFKDIPSVFLFYGEAYLIDEKIEFVVSELLSKEERKLCYQVISGDDLTVSSIIDEISTYSVFVEKKLINAKGLTATKEELQRLSDIIENGLPQCNYLTISLSKMDKRSAFFKSVSAAGVAVDCSISRGIGKKDIEEQRNCLRLQMNNILKNHHKTIEEKAFSNLIDLTGFNPEIFADNIEKLVSYTGKRNKITFSDVSKLVKRTKTDPIFDFTNAFSDKNSQKALFFLSSLLNADFHILQLLKALTNHIRKVFAVKCFIVSNETKGNKLWSEGMNFNTFNNSVVHEIRSADKALAKYLESYNEDASDFFLASRSKSTYPLYQLFIKSDKYSIDELENILIEIAEIDNKLKSSSQDSMILIQDFIFRFCN